LTLGVVPAQCFGYTAKRILD